MKMRMTWMTNKKEVLVDESTFIESTLTSKPQKIGKKGSKVVIKVDNLRMSAYPVLEDHELYIEDHPIYEVLETWPGRLGEKYSPRDQEILEQITEDNNVVELRIGNYEIVQQWTKRL